MKVLLISNMYPSLEQNNYGVFVKNFENAMINEEVEFVNKALIRGKGQNVFEKIKKYMFFYFDVVRFSLRNDFDIIYIHFFSHSTIPFIFLRFFIKKPIVINVHGSDIFPISKVGKFLQAITLHVLRNATLVVVPSEYFENVLIQDFGILKNKIYKYPSGGIDASLFQPESSKNKGDSFCIGFVSRIDFGKGWDILIEVINVIKKEKIIKNLNVKIIGDGPQKKQLLEKIHKYDLEEIVEYLGNIEHEKLPKYYNDMDVFVFPTQRKESLGLVGLEAMACGVPVIGSEIAGLKDYICHGDNGYLFKVGDVDALKDTLVKYWNLPSTIKQTFSNAARSTAREYDKITVNKKLKKRLELI